MASRNSIGRHLTLLLAVVAELVPLLSALNRLMDRLRNSIRRSEDFITEAAHRIRTPLVTVRSRQKVPNAIAPLPLACRLLAHPEAQCETRPGFIASRHPLA